MIRMIRSPVNQHYAQFTERELRARVAEWLSGRRKQSLPSRTIYLHILSNQVINKCQLIDCFMRKCKKHIFHYIIIIIIQNSVLILKLYMFLFYLAETANNRTTYIYLSPSMFLNQ